MKKILTLLFFAFLSLGLHAQYISEEAPQLLKRRGTHLRIDKQKLSKEEQAALLADIGGTDYTEAWKKAKRGRATGIGLTWGGGVLLVGGAGTAVVGALASMIGIVAGSAAGAIAGGITGGEGGAQSGAQAGADAGAEAGKPFFIGGLVGMGLGAACLGFGIPITVKNNRKLNGIVDQYNALQQPQAKEPQLTLGPTANGVGFRLVF